MSSVSEHVSLTITQDSVGIARAGFGIPMILSAYAAFAERVRFYTELSELATDGFATTGPEYLAATKMFGQSPCPEMIAIGRAALKPTMVYTLSLAAVRDSTAIVINVQGEGVTTTAATFTSGVGTTNDLIMAGLTTALNNVVGKNYTAVLTAGAGDTDTIVVTGSAAGEWFSLELDDVTSMKIAATHADPGVATDLAAIALENDTWYGICAPAYNSNACILGIAAYTEAVTKLYIADCMDSETVTLATAGGDTADDLHILLYDRTALAYHPSNANFMGAAWLGNCSPFEPGSETWKFKTLVGVETVTTTATHRVNLRAKKANTYQLVGSVSMTWDGTVASGNFIDVTRGLDWLNDDMNAAVFGVMAAARKVPMSDAGVNIIVNEVQGSLDRAVERTILLDDPAPLITFPRVRDISTANKAARILPDIKFSATLAGAIHKAVIAGVVSV